MGVKKPLGGGLGGDERRVVLERGEAQMNSTEKLVRGQMAQIVKRCSGAVSHGARCLAFGCIRRESR
jgi:hypothetical protein